MKKIFVDANGWIALNHKKDMFHRAAKKLNKKLLQEKYGYITTNFVLDKTYTGQLMKVGHFTAVTFGEQIRKSKITTIVHVTEKIEKESWIILKNILKKNSPSQIAPLL